MEYKRELKLPFFVYISSTKHYRLNFFIVSLITYLIPIGVLSVGMLDIYTNRNSGISKTIFSVFLFALLSMFIYNLMTEVEMAFFQIIAFAIFMPLSMLAGPLLLMFQQSLMGKKRKLLGEGSKVLLHFLPALYTILVLVVGLVLYSAEELNEILTIADFDEGDLPTLYARWVLGSTHVLWYVQLLWYAKRIGKLFEHQKRKYGKFYASYEERNERMMLQGLAVLGMVGVYDFLFWVIKIRTGTLFILVNFIVGGLLVWLILSGREQINIKRYRMYKLNSHEHELKDVEKYSKKRIRKTNSHI